MIFASIEVPFDIPPEEPGRYIWDAARVGGVTVILYAVNERKVWPGSTRRMREWFALLPREGGPSLQNPNRAWPQAVADALGVKPDWHVAEEESVPGRVY